MKMFRFPTRFLIVVELGLALLAAVGLTRLRADLASTQALSSPVASTFRRKLPALIASAICAGTALDVFIHQPRQNPMVSGREWLAAPASVNTIRADTPQPRTFTPRHRDLHRRSFQIAEGWTNVKPYFELRDVLEPNTGAFWGTPSADCYAGIAPRWYVDVWGDHSREASLTGWLSLPDFDAGTLRVHPSLPKVLGTFGVTHVLSPYPQEGAPLQLVAHDGGAYIYRVDGAARVRFVRAARRVTADRDAMGRLVAADFDPDREILLHDAPDSIRPRVEDVDNSWKPGPSRAVIRREDAREIAIEAEAPEDGFLLLADTYFPGWTAHVDGKPTPIYRANLSVRGIRLPKGRHEVHFTYDAPGFVRGAWITMLAISTLLVWAGAAVYVERRLWR